MKRGGPCPAMHCKQGLPGGVDGSRGTRTDCNAAEMTSTGSIQAVPRTAPTPTDARNSLYMQTGTGTVDSLTTEVEAARGISDDMESLLEGHREVERILKKRQITGMFPLVTDPA